MKLTYAYPRKCPTTLLRFVLGTLLMKLAPGGTFLLITYHLLLTTYYFSLVTDDLLLITYYLLLITYHIIYHPYTDGKLHCTSL